MPAVNFVAQGAVRTDADDPPRSKSPYHSFSTHVSISLGLERFRLSDIPEIVTFLNRVWGIAYGPAVRPVFTEEYLRWLYGGPDADQTAIVGVRKDGRIVSVKAMLARELIVAGGTPRRAYLGTHLAIDNQLSLAERLALLSVADQLWMNREICTPADIAYTVFDAVKPLVKRTEALVAKRGVTRVIGTFSNMVVTPELVERSPTNLVSRPGTPDDVAEIAALAGRLARSASLALHLTAARVRHHWFNAPSGEVFVTESGDGLLGACCVYALGTTRGAEPAMVAVLESFLATRPEAGIALLREALHYARRIGARGVVLENGTWLDEPRAYGLVPSSRQMQLAVMSRDPVDIGTSWLVDIK
jgi:hypothetical protein